MAPWRPGRWGAVIAGAGAAIAYAASEVASWKRFAPYVLVVSQLGLLTWAMLVLGPRPSLLALVPALIETALLMSGALLASVLLFGALLIYALFAGLSISIGLAPVNALDPTAAAVLDVVFVVVGLLAALWLLLTIQGGRERAQATARARRHEADVLRNLVTQFRQETQDETGKLESALIQALKGYGIGPVPSEGMYRLLAETIMDTASRLEVLQRDREERLRLEGSLRVVIRAVERQWLGIQPEWPGHTGTAIDELVALLRTPRLELTYQHETESPSITPRLIPIPTLAIEHDTPAPTSISRPLSSASWLASTAAHADLISIRFRQPTKIPQAPIRPMVLSGKALSGASIHPSFVTEYLDRAHSRRLPGDHPRHQHAQQRGGPGERQFSETDALVPVADWKASWLRMVAARLTSKSAA